MCRNVNKAMKYLCVKSESMVGTEMILIFDALISINEWDLSRFLLIYCEVKYLLLVPHPDLKEV
jgi:hypothetical protein